MKRTVIQNRPALRANGRRGFTMVEMLVVLGIIGILSSSLLGAFGYLKKAAWQSRALSQAHLVATALTLHLQNERSWPEDLLNRTEFDDKACAVLQRNKLVDLTTWKTLPNEDGSGGALSENSPDRYGLLDPWGKAMMRKNPLTKVEQARVHRLQYRLDRNFDGYVDGSEGAPQGARVRAAILVWTRGPDGQDDFNSKNPKAHGRYPYDDRLSWSHGTAKADN